MATNIKSGIYVYDDIWQQVMDWAYDRELWPEFRRLAKLRALSKKLKTKTTCSVNRIQFNYLIPLQKLKIKSLKDFRKKYGKNKLLIELAYQEKVKEKWLANTNPYRNSIELRTRTVQRPRVQ